MKLIMNADDFGLSESVNLGIVACLEAGVVKSTTVMMNQKGTDHAIALYQQGLVPEVGLHFTVTAGRPLSPLHQVSSLVDEQGYFIDRATLMTKHDVCEKEVYRELKAQYRAAIDAGFAINHIDTHHFAGVFAPLKQAFIRFANEVDIPVRRVDSVVSGQEGLKVATPDSFEIDFFDHGVSLEQLKVLLLGCLEKAPNGTVELMCHPSNQHNADLKGVTGYIDKRYTEQQILTSPELIAWLESHQIECVGFDELTHQRRQLG